MNDDVVDDDPRIGILADVDAFSFGERHPLAVNVIEKIHKRSRAIRRAKQHHHISSLDSIRPLKSKLFLTGKSDCHCQLVVAGRSIVKPQPLAGAKFF